jgi:hypothetical protein
MPFYRFIIEGRGDITGGIIGFYTTRWSWGTSPREAADKALKQVSDDWETGKSASLKQSGSITLEVDQWWQIKPWHIWSGPNRGHTFYSGDGPSEEEPPPGAVREV